MKKTGLYIQDSTDQCPKPINADQNSGTDPNVDQFQSILCQTAPEFEF